MNQEIAAIAKSGKKRTLALEELKQAIDELAEALKTAYPDKRIVILPDNCIFEWWTIDYRLSRGSGGHAFMVTKTEKTHDSPQTFLALLETGWLDEVNKIIEADERSFRNGHEKITKAITVIP